MRIEVITKVAVSREEAMAPSRSLKEGGGGGYDGSIDVGVGNRGVAEAARNLKMTPLCPSPPASTATTVIANGGISKKSTPWQDERAPQHCVPGTALCVRLCQLFGSSSSIQDGVLASVVLEEDVRYSGPEIAIQ